MNYKKFKSLWQTAYTSIARVNEKAASATDRLDEQWQHERDMEKRLIYYEYTLHHRLRAIWARINGLNHLVQVTENEDEKKKIRELLDENLKEMDYAITDISNKLSGQNRKNV